MSALPKDIGDKARRLLGQRPLDVNVVDPGAAASVGVRRMDPEVVDQPRGYEPALPVPSAPTPSGDDIPESTDETTFTPDPEGGVPSAEFLKRAAGSPRGASPPQPKPAQRVSVRAPALITAPPRYESLASAAPREDAPAPGGDAGGVPSEVLRSVMGGAQAPAVESIAPEGPDPRQLAASNRLIAALARAGATAVGQPNNAGLDALAENADRPILDARERALDDPNSPESAMARDVIGRALPEAKIAPWFKGLTARSANNNPMLRALLSRAPKASDLMAERKQADLEQYHRDLGRAALLRAQRTGGAAAADRAEKRLETDVQKAGKDLEPNAQMKADLETVIAAAEESDIPGVGVVAGRLPDWLLSSEGVQTRQAAQRLMNGILRAASGQAVTPSEAERQLAARGMGPGATEQSFRLGLQALAKEAQSAMTRTQAKYRPQVLDELGSRGGVLAKDMPTYGAGEAGRAGGGMVRVQAPNGKVKLVPTAQVQAAVAAGGKVLQ